MLGTLLDLLGTLPDPLGTLLGLFGTILDMLIVDDSTGSVRTLVDPLGDHAGPVWDPT